RGRGAGSSPREVPPRRVRAAGRRSAWAVPYGQPPPSTSGPGRHPFKGVARVRIPLGASRETSCKRRGSPFLVDGTPLAPCPTSAPNVTTARSRRLERRSYRRAGFATPDAVTAGG